MGSAIKASYQAWDNRYRFDVTCVFCGVEQEPFFVTEKQWNSYHGGDHPFIEDAYSDLTAEQRELLISGVCTKCWEESMRFFDED